MAFSYVDTYIMSLMGLAMISIFHKHRPLLFAVCEIKTAAGIIYKGPLHRKDKKSKFNT